MTALFVFVCVVPLLILACLGVLLLAHYDTEAVKRWDGYRRTTVITKGQPTTLESPLVENDPTPSRVRAVLMWLFGDGEKVVRIESQDMTQGQVREMEAQQMRDARAAVRQRDREAA